MPRTHETNHEVGKTCNVSSVSTNCIPAAHRTMRTVSLLLHSKGQCPTQYSMRVTTLVRQTSYTASTCTISVFEHGRSSSPMFRPSRQQRQNPASFVYITFMNSKFTVLSKGFLIFLYWSCSNMYEQIETSHV